MFARTEDYAGTVQQIYGGAANQLIELGLYFGVKEGETFSYEANGLMKAKATNILKAMNAKVYGAIQGGIKAEWAQSNVQNDKLLAAIFGKDAFEKNHFARYFDRNEKAMNAFMDRSKKEGGLGLSQKVWNYTGQLKAELEVALDLGIGEGGSAAHISKAVRSYLNEPDKLFKRVQITTKDAEGNITKTGRYKLSKAAQAYHPGQGVYRSSYKNAMRLTRTETNMAYLTADHERWQQFDFVVGYEVKLSSNHPVTDICNDFAGKYPKTFKFVSWHPQCRCFVIAILCTDKELDSLSNALLDGKELKNFSSVNQVTDLPKGYNDWIDANAERVKTAKSIPYFIKNNYVDGELAKGLNFAGLIKPIVVPPIVVPPIVKPVVVPDPVRIPTDLAKDSDYLKGTKIEFKNEFFAMVDQSKPVGISLDPRLKNSYYSPATKKVHIANGARNTSSEWHRESVIYHEYGHAIDWQRDSRFGPDVKTLMDKHRKLLGKKQARTYTFRDYDYSIGDYVNKTVTGSVSDISHIDTQLKNLSAKVWRMKPETFTKLGISKADVSEQIGSARDTIMSLNSSYGYGHSKAYFKGAGMREAEFIAHCFENKFATNTIFKKYLPELYQDMIQFIGVLK